MTLEQFIEKIRAGVIAGVYTVKDTVKYINARGWSTTRDVPENKRQEVLTALTDTKPVDLTMRASD